MIPETEFITVEEFATRYGVARSTVYDWIRTGTLEAGVHYVRLGKTIRFPWGEVLLTALLDLSRKQAAPAPKLAKRNRVPRKAGTVINLSYR